ncbi:glutathione-dependent formaldehyde-activating enzyme [Colletotrichum paranaense]|uniref:Glutathione-dependent formaldehyde-activating enzyme n=1 Tax=Colletotrichum paranaense TaxID=1914294 RepID=A0ABQ9T5N1_9PEZI|nr:glutathione-dependent formaldehyde-activating enzyme [Colletotrichum paranaense]KAK1547096.1 glutathione-dependent formaldehyde-activating enzyme [Colletotrichum paranaense]
MDARCQCGAVSFKTPLPQPLRLYICHCEEWHVQQLSCTPSKRQTGSAFGTSAIFPKFKLPKADLMGVYARPTASGATLYCYFCRNCGTRLIHATPDKNVVSVKGGCIDGLDWKTAVHIWTKNAMVPIPEGAENHSEEAEYTDYGDQQEALDQPTDLRGSGGTLADAVSVDGRCELSGTTLKAIVH